MSGAMGAMGAMRMMRVLAVMRADARPGLRAAASRVLAAGLVAVGLTVVPSGTRAAPTPTETYDAADAWLCRPGRADDCAGTLAVAEIGPDGRVAATRTLRPDPAATIDCFYLYPTISMAPGGNSPLVAGPGERRAIAHQFAAFASVCRPFAPVYRQVTLAGLRVMMSGQAGGVDVQLAIEDVRAAWRHYLANDNGGRGVVLIGHSQGSRMLMELLRRDIEGQPAQQWLVSAMLLGYNVGTAAGSDTGGTFRTLPLCREPGQTGCVISYASFRADVPPPADARFGRDTPTVSNVACTDPVALSGRPVQSMFASDTNLLGSNEAARAWRAMTAAAGAPYVDLPGLIGAACVDDGPRHYLSVTLESARRGERPDDLPFDLVARGRRLDDWGLHLVDVNLVMGNLLEIVRRQTEAWAAKPR